MSENETARGQGTAGSQRVDWVDYAKGICICLVVMMHSTLGVEKAFGLAEQSSAMGHFIAWARPFRMPDFFLISGLFLARRISAPWPRYLDVKAVHFLYFYFLWMAIQFLFKGYGMYHDLGSAGLLRELGLAFVEPLGTLWFIYLLAIFFPVTKLLQRVPPYIVFVLAALLEILPIETGWILVDEFAARYVYFFAGYWLARPVFRFAAAVTRTPLVAVGAALILWAVFNAWMVFDGYAKLQGLSLIMGFIGAAAVITAGTVLARTGVGGFFRYLGENSIVVYLAFFLFMATTRSILVRFAPWLGVDAISIAVTLAGIIGPVILHFLVKRTPLRFLFVRPAIAKLESWMKGWHSAAHDSAKELRQPQVR